MMYEEFAKLWSEYDSNETPSVLEYTLIAEPLYMGGIGEPNMTKESFVKYYIENRDHLVRTHWEKVYTELKDSSEQRIFEKTTMYHNLELINHSQRVNLEKTIEELEKKIFTYEHLLYSLRKSINAHLEE